MDGSLPEACCEGLMLCAEGQHVIGKTNQHAIEVLSMWKWATAYQTTLLVIHSSTSPIAQYL